MEQKKKGKPIYLIAEAGIRISRPRIGIPTRGEAYSRRGNAPLLSREEYTTRKSQAWRWDHHFRRSAFGRTAKKSGRIAPHVDDTMYVMETGGHKVAPVPTSTRLKKVVDYNKSMSHHQHHQHHHQQQHHHQHHHHQEGERGGGGGGGTHIAATVKNTVRRLLRRTKSHRDAPSTNASTMTSNVANGGHAVVALPPRARHDVATRNDNCNAIPPPSDVPFAGRYSRARKLQVREI